jgi:hypothetical protein
MKTDKALINKAIDALISITNSADLIKVNGTKEDIIIKIGGYDFGTITVKTITTGSKGLIINSIKDAEKRGSLPIVLIAEYIPLEIAKEFNSLALNYIDASGNTHLVYNNLLIFISGQKRIKASKTQQSRAFQETGIKLIFGLLSKPELMKYSYRDISEIIEISLASTGYVIQELTDLNFLLKTNDKKVLKNKKELMNRWIIAYHDALRPRLLKRKMRFIDKASYANWKGIPLNKTKEINTLWGGEPGAAILTNFLKPSFYTIYTTKSWQECAKDYGLVPDENGDVEILQMFWNFIDPKEKDLAIVPPTLIYADLINSSNDRNVETAKIIFDNELQNIK